MSQIDTISQLRSDMIKSGIQVEDVNTDTLVQMNYDMQKQQKKVQNMQKVF